MNNCLQCGALVAQVKGKREKKFCGETCRSNFWYSKNKKGCQNKKKLPCLDKKQPTDLTINEKKPYMNDIIKRKLGIK